ncbi:MAG: hypothetical protein KDK44_01660, partial [Chlamydiia bacterium]|nr:hypothetical protein [Chlamydiia bacterium]
IEGGSMLVKQWKAEEKDWVVVGLAAMQIGLGGIRGYQGASMGFKYGMTKIHKPEVCRLGCDGELATGELIQEQLDQVNKIYEDVGNSKFTEVHPDQKGNVINARNLTGERLVSELDASVSGKVDVNTVFDKEWLAIMTNQSHFYHQYFYPVSLGANFP